MTRPNARDLKDAHQCSVDAVAIIKARRDAVRDPQRRKLLTEAHWQAVEARDELHEARHAVRHDRDPGEHVDRAHNALQTASYHTKRSGDPKALHALYALHTTAHRLTGAGRT